MSRLQIIEELPATGRKSRKPQHPFHIFHHPYVIQPFFIAPVLPGETMKSATVQSRAVSSPIDNPLIGWWLEHYLFYVPMSAMPNFDTVKAMFVDEAETGLTAGTTDVKHRYFAWGYDWGAECLQAITEAYFRQAGVAWNAAGTTITDHNGETVPIAEVSTESWLDSVILTADLPTAPDELDVVTGMYGSVDTSRVLYERMRSLGFTQMTYDDFLRLEGQTPVEEAAVTLPELVRFSRDWNYPANTIDPITGTPTSAMSWATAFRADKDRYFREPGFLYGVTVARPKVYFSRQYGTASSFMRTARAWMPSALHEPAASLFEHLNTQGALSTGTADATSPSGSYVVDLRDLLIYGEQFTNVAAADQGGCNFVALPTTAMEKRFVSITDIEGLFPGSTDGTRLIKQDGIVSLNVLGRQTDQTRTLNA